MKYKRGITIIPFKVKDVSYSCPECNREINRDMIVNIGNINPNDYGYSQVDTKQTCRDS